MRCFFYLAWVWLLSGWTCCIIGQEILFPGQYEIEHNEPVYYQELLEEMEFSLSWDKVGQGNFDTWQEEGRRLVRLCGGIWPLYGKFDYEVLAEQQREGYRAQRIRLNISCNSRITAYLLVPDGEGPFPALVALHDHGGQFSIGKEKMVKPFGVPDDVIQTAQAWVDKNYEGEFIADYYARNGYVVFVTDALYWGERGRKEGSTGADQQALAANLLQMGSSWTTYILADDVRSVDFLAELPYVDPLRIGAVGFSMGGFRAWLLSAVCEEVAAAASICWMTTTKSVMQPGSHVLKGTSAFSMMLPGIKRYMDYPHIASLTAPRPLLFFNGLQDKLFFPEGTEDAYRIMRRVWESERAGDKLVTQWWDVPHFFTKPMQAQVLDFFNKHLENQ